MYAVMIYVSDCFESQFIVHTKGERDELCKILAGKFGLVEDEYMTGTYHNLPEREKPNCVVPLIEVFHEGVDEWRAGEEIDISYILE